MTPGWQHWEKMLLSPHAHNDKLEKRYYQETYKSMMVPWIFRIKRGENKTDRTEYTFDAEEKENMQEIINVERKNFEKTKRKMMLPWQIMINGPMLRG